MNIKSSLINGFKGMLIFASLVTSVSMAASWSDIVSVQGLAEREGSTIPEMYIAVNRLTGSSYIKNSQLEPLYVDDIAWNNLNGLAVIGGSAGNTNTLGIYDIVTTVVTTVTPGYVALSAWVEPPHYYGVTHSGTFGWHLSSNGSNWYSEDHRNSPAYDHMLVFALGDSVSFEDQYGIFRTFDNPYLIAWEDLNLGDTDYNDIMYLVNATPIPIPPSVLLFLSGLFGLMGTGAFRRYRA